MRHAEQGRQMQYVDLKMTESMLHTRMQDAYLQMRRPAEDSRTRRRKYQIGWLGGASE